MSPGPLVGSGHLALNVCGPCGRSVDTSQVSLPCVLVEATESGGPTTPGTPSEPLGDDVAGGDLLGFRGSFVGPAVLSDLLANAIRRAEHPEPANPSPSRKMLPVAGGFAPGYPLGFLPVPADATLDFPFLRARGPVHAVTL